MDVPRYETITDTKGNQSVLIIELDPHLNWNFWLDFNFSGHTFMVTINILDLGGVGYPKFDGGWLDKWSTL